MIKFAIFDVGQTIYPYTLQPLNDLMLQHTADKNTFLNGHSAFDYDYKPYMRGTLPHQEFAKELCRFCYVPYSDNLLPEIDTALRLGRGEMFTETLDAMHLFQSHNIKIGILSNALPILGDAKTNLAPPEYIFTSYKLGLLKPEIEIYQTLAQKLGVAYAEILFIDDKERNIIPARKLGINGIIFNKDTLLEEIKSYLPKDEN